MQSKEVTDRQKSASAVLASIEAHADAAGKILLTRFQEVLRDGEAAPDMALALRLFGRMLARDNESAVTADDRHETEKSDDDAPRSARDEAAVKVRDACVVARDAVSTVYGDAALKALKMDAVAPNVSDGAALARWAENASVKLGDARVALPKPKSKGVSLDRDALAEAIREHLPTLKAALGDVERERRELEGTQAAKNRAVDRNDATFSTVAGITSVVLRAAGMTEQSERVRPSARRPGRTEATEEGGEGGGSAPTGGGNDPTG